MPKTHYEVLQDQAPNCESRWKEFEVYEIPKEPLDDVFTAAELDDIATAANMVMYTHVYPFLTVDGPALIRWLKTRISGAIQRAFAAGGFRFVYRFHRRLHPQRQRRHLHRGPRRSRRRIPVGGHRRPHPEADHRRRLTHSTHPPTYIRKENPPCPEDPAESPPQSTASPTTR